MYKIAYSKEVAKKDLPLLPATMKKRIKKAIEQRLMQAPYLFGKPLQYSFKGQRSLRVGDYRIIYVIEEEATTVIITAIRHRSVV